MAELILHPLINKDIPYYDTGSKTAIEELEDEYTVDEVISFSKINIFKYGYRGGDEANAKKVKTYTSYLTVLKGLHNMGLGSMRVSKAYEITNKKWRYK